MCTLLTYPLPFFRVSCKLSEVKLHEEKSKVEHVSVLDTNGIVKNPIPILVLQFNFQSM